MSDKQPLAATSSTFESIKRTNSSGAEYWSARDLARTLEYLNFRNFEPVLARAREACTQSGHPVADHIAQSRTMVDIGSGAQRAVEDWALSRYACYLVIQNADPSKPVVALGQTYFAVQTRRQELADDETVQEERKRLHLRDEMKKHNKKLAGAAKQAGVVQPQDYALFMDHGYRGLYGGLGSRDIRPARGSSRSSRFSITWAARNWRRISSGRRKRRTNCAGRTCGKKPTRIACTRKLAARCGGRFRNWVARCRRTCRRRRASSRWRDGRRSG